MRPITMSAHTSNIYTTAPLSASGDVRMVYDPGSLETEICGFFVPLRTCNKIIKVATISIVCTGVLLLSGALLPRIGAPEALSFWPLFAVGFVAGCVFDRALRSWGV